MASVRNIVASFKDIIGGTMDMIIEHPIVDRIAAHASVAYIKAARVLGEIAEKIAPKTAKTLENSSIKREIVEGFDETKGEQPDYLKDILDGKHKSSGKDKGI